MFFEPSQAAAFVAQARTALPDTVLASTDDFVTQDLLDQLGGSDDAEGIVFSALDLTFLGEEPYLTALLTPYTEAFGGPEAAFPSHAWAFDAANRLLDVVESFQRLGTQQLVIPRTALRDAFAATSVYPGVSGSMTCDANGDCNSQDFVIRVVQGGAFVDV